MVFGDGTKRALWKGLEHMGVGQMPPGKPLGSQGRPSEVPDMGGFQKLGALFRSPYNKNHSISGSIWGPLILETPIQLEVLCGIDVGSIAGNGA